MMKHSINLTSYGDVIKIEELQQQSKNRNMMAGKMSGMSSTMKWCVCFMREEK